MYYNPLARSSLLDSEDAAIKYGRDIELNAGLSGGIIGPEYRPGYDYAPAYRPFPPAALTTGWGGLGYNALGMGGGSLKYGYSVGGGPSTEWRGDNDRRKFGFAVGQDEPSAGAKLAGLLVGAAITATAGGVLGGLLAGRTGAWAGAIFGLTAPLAVNLLMPDDEAA